MNVVRFENEDVIATSMIAKPGHLMDLLTNANGFCGKDVLFLLVLLDKSMFWNYTLEN